LKLPVACGKIITMKRGLSIFALLLLAACIEVTDIGAYWDKGTVDKDLVGQWKQDAAQDPEIRAITIENNEYKIESLDDKSKGAKDYKPLLARTLTLGKYTFFMTEPVQEKDNPKHNNSNIWRYKLKGDTVTLYRLQPAAMSDYLQALKKKHPKEKDPQISIENHKTRNADKRYVAISRLDDTVAKILISVPDNAAYWEAAKIYARQRP